MKQAIAYSQLFFGLMSTCKYAVTIRSGEKRVRFEILIRIKIISACVPFGPWNGGPAYYDFRALPPSTSLFGRPIPTQTEPPQPNFRLN